MNDINRWILDHFEPIVWAVVLAGAVLVFATTYLWKSAPVWLTLPAFLLVSVAGFWSGGLHFLRSTPSAG
jgi:hypothetical protein